MAWVRVLTGAEADRSIELRGGEVLLGRSPEADVRLDPGENLLVSARHAVLTHTPEGWTVRDVGSRNGTWVGDERLHEPRLLQPGDRIRLGGREGAELVFETEEPTVPSAPAPARPSRPSPWVAVALGAAVILITAVGVWRTARTPLPTPSVPVPVAGPPPETEVLRREVEGLADRLESVGREADSLRAALASARRDERDTAAVAELRRDLQAATTALTRHQLAASLDFGRLVERARPAIAHLRIEYEDGSVVAGTAFTVDSAGHLLTNRHLVRREGSPPTLVSVQLAGSGEAHPVEVVAVANVDDVALLRLVSGPGAASPIPLNDRPDTVRSGQPIAIMGFPLGGDGAAEPVVTAGLLGERRDGLLEIQGYGAEGSSGSPVLDGDGALVGLIAGGRVDGPVRWLYAVPVDRIRAFLERWPS